MKRHIPGLSLVKLACQWPQWPGKLPSTGSLALEPPLPPNTFGSNLSLHTGPSLVTLKETAPQMLRAS